MVLCSTQGNRGPPDRKVPSSDEFAGVDISETDKVEECEWTYKHTGDTSWGFLKITEGELHLGS